MLMLCFKKWWPQLHSSDGRLPLGASFHVLCALFYCPAKINRQAFLSNEIAINWRIWRTARVED